LLAPLLKQYPSDVTVLQRVNDLESGPMHRTFSAMIEAARRRFEQAPDDVPSMFLYAKAITGYQTTEAIALFQRVLEKAPGFQPARLELARIYASFPLLKDQPKAVALIEEVQKACPASVAGYDTVLSLNDQALLEKSAQRLRKVLDAKMAAGDESLILRRFGTLWSIDFRARPAAGYPGTRKQVEADIEKIRALQLTKDPQWFEVLEQGYQLLGDKEKQKAIQTEFAAAFPQSTNAFFQIMRTSVEENPYPKLDDALVIRQAHASKTFEITDQWLKRWPHNPMIWQMRLGAFRNSANTPPGMLEATADRLLSSYNERPDAFRSFPPLHYGLAEMYLLHKVRLERIPDLVAEGTRELEESREQQSKSDFADKKSDSHRLGNYGMVYSEGYPLLLDAWLAMKRPADARKVLVEMEQWLDRYKPTADPSEEDRKTYDFRTAILWEKRGTLAEAEGRKADAVASYLSAVALIPKPGPAFRAYRLNPALRAQELWRDLGGTREGLQALTDRQPAKDTERWSAMAMPLPDFEITDVAGRRWRLADLKGQRTLVNVWATWCGPCVHELPTIQKIGERLKERAGYQVITFNVNENPGLIEPFLKERKLTIPALPAKELVDRVVPLLAIPRTWLINPSGVIAFEMVGFAHSKDMEERLISESIQKMEQMK
jgi:cytochrome c biogenesis protein CcmG/thiol:disulfide interchange protein DsbE